MAELFDIRSSKGGAEAKVPRKPDVCFENLLKRLRDEDSPEPWEEFFQHFNRLIIKTIRKTFIRWDQRPDYDPVNEVYLLFVERVMERRKLKDIKHSAALPSWIRITVQNLANDWLAKQKSRKNVHKKQEMRNAVSLDQAVGATGEQRMDDITGHDTMKEFWQRRELSEELENVMEDIERLDEEAFLIVKAFCLFYEPFSEREIALIARRRKVESHSVREEIDGLMETLVVRNDARIKKLENETLRWSEIRQKEAQLNIIQKDADTCQEQKTILTTQIEQASEKLERSREKGQRIIRPRNVEIAQLLGIPEADAKQLSLKILRIRKRLRRLMVERSQKNLENT